MKLLTKTYYIPDYYDVDSLNKFIWDKVRCPVWYYTEDWVTKSMFQLIENDIKISFPIMHDIIGLYSYFQVYYSEKY